MFPDKFERYCGLVPKESQGNLIEAYYHLLTSDNEEERLEAARRFVEWEINISKVHLQEEWVQKVLQDARKFAPFARAECHFFREKGFLRSEMQLLEDCSKI